jgi:hypothetical protein
MLAYLLIKTLLNQLNVPCIYLFLRDELLLRCDLKCHCIPFLESMPPFGFNTSISRFATNPALIRSEKRGNLILPWNPTMFRVTAVKGRSVIAWRDGRRFMRHTSARLRKYQVRTLPNPPLIQPKKAITETFVQLGNDLITQPRPRPLLGWLWQVWSISDYHFGKYRHDMDIYLFVPIKLKFK